jgi:hypothetical protein
VGFGHVYVAAEQAPVLEALDRHLAALGFARFEMTKERHPTKMKEIHESRTRLYWVSPALGRWTGVFEFRYYHNEFRERWGYADEVLAAALSRSLSTVVFRLEVADSAGFWLYSKLVGGEEIAGNAYQDSILEETADRSHPRYELNRIIEEEGLRNVGLGYENIPGPMVRPIELLPQGAEGVEGLAGFVHRAYERRA